MAEKTPSEKRTVRLIINDADTGKNVTDVVITGESVPDPTKWTELPEMLETSGKIVEIERKGLDNIFTIKVDMS